MPRTAQIALGSLAIWHVGRCQICLGNVNLSIPQIPECCARPSTLWWAPEG